MIENLRGLIQRVLGTEGNFTYLPIRDQVDIFLNFLGEGAILPREFIRTYLRWAQTQLQSANLSCQRLIILDNHPGITKDSDTGLVYDAFDVSNFTGEKGSILYRDTWYERVQNKVGQQKGKVSLAGLGLRFYPRDWFMELHSPHHKGAIDLWAELRRGGLGIRLDLLKSAKDGHLFVERISRFSNAEDFRQQITGGLYGFPKRTSTPPLIEISIKKQI